jgi:hypothetical protein
MPYYGKGMIEGQFGIVSPLAERKLYNVCSYKYKVSEKNTG